MGHSEETAFTRTTGRYFTWAAQLLTLCFVLQSARAAIHPFFDESRWMMYEEDDFFYYLKVAVNLAQGHGSSFNGIVPTNGYHPLWCWLLTAVCSVAPTHTAMAVQIFLAIAIFVAMLATYQLCRSILGGLQANPLLVNAFAAYVALYCSHFFFGGMEVILTVPLLLGVMLFYQREHLWSGSLLESFYFGLLLSALVLSRLDTILFVVLLAVATLLSPTLRSRLNGMRVAGVCLGLLPVALYFALNHLYFGTWLPISGMAKQLKRTHTPSSIPWHSLFHGTSGPWMNLIPIILALALLPFVFKKMTETQRVLYPVLLVFPFVHVLLLSCLSDWPLWDWYFYSLRIALCVSFALFLLWQPSKQALNTCWITVALALFVLGVTLHKSRKVPGGRAEGMYEAAKDIQEFARTHPGVYAMGDRAGMPGYLLSAPLIQTEGLVMDLHFLEIMKKEQPLDAALANYNVRYYIATNYAPYTGCFHAVEPIQAGPASPHLIVDLCQQPAAVFTHGDMQTLIFALQAPVEH